MQRREWERRSAMVAVTGLVAAAMLAAFRELAPLAKASKGWALFFVVALVALTLVSGGSAAALRLIEFRRQRAQERDDERSATETREREIQSLLTVGMVDGRLRRLSQLEDWRLGATPTRYTTQHRDPYVARPAVDAGLREALAATAPPYGFVVVVGRSKAGKSRTAIEAARTALRELDPAVAAPASGEALSQLTRLSPPLELGAAPGLVWLDDLTAADLQHLTEPVLEWLAERAIVIATITLERWNEVHRAESEVTKVARHALRRATRFDLAFGLTDEERAEATALYPDEDIAASLAETLVGGPELLDRYRAGPDENPAGCAIVQAAIDVRRCGLPRPVTRDELRRLFPFYLYALRPDLDATAEHFDEGLRWARKPVASHVSLLRVPIDEAGAAEPDSFEPLDYVLGADDGHHDHQVRPIPAATWRELIDFLPTDEVLDIGVVAHLRELREHAIRAFRLVAGSSDPDHAPAAETYLGMVLAESGDTEGAKAAYQRAIGSAHPSETPWAQVNLGILLAEIGDAGAARAAFRASIDSGDPDVAGWAAYCLGQLLEREGDSGGARAAYQRAIDSGHADHAPAAEVNLGMLLAGEGDVAGARAAYQRAIDSGHPSEAPWAQVNLGQLLAEQGDVAGAKAAYQSAIDSGDPDHAPWGELNLGQLLEEQGDLAGAKTAFRHVIATGHPDQAPAAEVRLARLLAEDGDVAGARAAYQRAIDSGDPDETAWALVNLGQLLAEQGDAAGAQAAYQRVIDSGDPDHAPAAGVNLGILLAEQGDVAGAKAVFQRVIDSGHPDQTPWAGFNLGVLLTEQDDVAGAEAVFQRVIDSGHRECAPAAYVCLGLLFAIEEKAGAAKAAFQRAIDSGHPDHALWGRQCLGELLAEEGDVAAARAAFQQVIDSGHPDYAPEARESLSGLPAET